MTSFLQEWRIVSSIILFLICIPAPLTHAASYADPNALEGQRRTNLLCALAVYGPFSGVFIVDTGASYSVAYGSEPFRKVADRTWQFRERQMRFAVGSESVPVIENISLAAFGDAPRPSRLILLEKPDRSPMLSGIDGILGLPEMRENCVRFDLKNQTVSVLDSTFQPNEGAVKTHLVKNAEFDVRVPVRIGSSGETRVVVDTGCGRFILLRSSTLKFQSRLGNAIPAEKVTFSTASSICEVQTYILKSVTISGFEFHDVQAFESDFDAIGMGCFSHFDMVLDFPKDEMWLTPHSNEWPRRIPPDASGLVLGFLDTNVLSLLRIQPDSAASKSELKVDDQILLFDGKEPKDLSMREIQQRQTLAGTVLPLRIRRGDQEIDIGLPLGYSFEYPPKWPSGKNELETFGEFLEKDKKLRKSEETVPKP